MHPSDLCKHQNTVIQTGSKQTTHFLKHTAGHCYFAKHKSAVPYQSKAKLFPFSFKNKQISTHQNKQIKSKKDSRRPSWMGSTSQDTGK